MAKRGVETIVDLAIGRFDLRNGAVTVADRKSDFNASGAELRARMGYNALSLQLQRRNRCLPLYLRYGRQSSPRRERQAAAHR